MALKHQKTLYKSILLATTTGFLLTSPLQAVRNGVNSDSESGATNSTTLPRASEGATTSSPAPVATEAKRREKAVAKILRVFPETKTDQERRAKDAIEQKLSNGYPLPQLKTIAQYRKKLFNNSPLNEEGADLILRIIKILASEQLDFIRSLAFTISRIEFDTLKEASDIGRLRLLHQLTLKYTDELDDFRDKFALKFHTFPRKKDSPYTSYSATSFLIQAAISDKSSQELMEVMGTFPSFNETTNLPRLFQMNAAQIKASLAFTFAVPKPPKKQQQEKGGLSSWFSSTSTSTSASDIESGSELQSPYRTVRLSQLGGDLVDHALVFANLEPDAIASLSQAFNNEGKKLFTTDMTGNQAFEIIRAFAEHKKCGDDVSSFVSTLSPERAAFLHNMLQKVNTETRIKIIKSLAPFAPDSITCLSSNIVPIADKLGIVVDSDGDLSGKVFELLPLLGPLSTDDFNEIVSTVDKINETDSYSKKARHFEPNALPLFVMRKIEQFNRLKAENDDSSSDEESDS